MQPKELAIDRTDPILRLDVSPSSSAQRRLRRGIHLLPSGFTVANLMCGCYVIRVAVDGNVMEYDYAARAIWIAWIFDAFDGALARAMGTTGTFGKEFDSLADIVTFGIAPVFLTCVWALRPPPLVTSQHRELAMGVGCLAGLFYIVCCAWRLARFNLQPQKPGENRHFLGMPTPAAALLLAAVIHYVGHPMHDVAMSWLLIALLVILGLLMLSSVRHLSFKNIHWTRRQRSLSVILVMLLLAVVMLFSRIALLLIASTYAVHGLALQLSRFARHRGESRI
jgi:CDP-diacylglycerol---serine O-phosphatidyltransferase